MHTSQNVIAAFGEEQTERLTGITRSQLRYWDKTGFYKPSYAEENRRVAFSRIYSFRDIVALRVLSLLRNQYSVSLQYLRDVRDRLTAETDPERWTGVRLYVLDRRVYWREPGTGRPQEIPSGQYLVPVALEEVIADTKYEIEKLKGRRGEDQIGSIERSRYVVHNAPVLAGTRISVSSIKRFAEAGYSTEQILKEYPDLTKKDIEAALKYRESSSAA